MAIRGIGPEGTPSIPPHKFPKGVAAPLKELANKIDLVAKKLVLFTFPKQTSATYTKEPAGNAEKVSSLTQKMFKG